MDRTVFSLALTRYLTLFAETDRVRRLVLAEDCFTADAELVGDWFHFKGYEGIMDKVAWFHGRYPGARLVLASGLQIIQSHARYRTALVDRDAEVFAQGEAVMELAGDGRIKRVLAFWGPTPTQPEDWPEQFLLPAAAQDRTAMQLNQITVPALDYAHSVTFYRLLGFKQIVSSPPRYARFECPDGETTFSIHASDTPAAPGPVIYFECAELDQQVRKLEAAGIEFVQQPRDEPWLWREARLKDPAGNLLCLYQAGVNRRFPPWRMQGS